MKFHLTAAKNYSETSMSGERKKITATLICRSGLTLKPNVRADYLINKPLIFCVFTNMDMQSQYSIDFQEQ